MNLLKNTYSFFNKNQFSWAALVLRIVLGCILAWASLQKLLNFDQTYITVKAYRILPIDLAQPFAYVLPFVELFIGLSLIIGLYTRYSAFFMAMAMLVFIGVIVSAWARGLQIDCGCFGPGGDLPAGKATTYFLDIMRDLGIFILCLWLIIFPKSKFEISQKFSKNNWW